MNKTFAVRDHQNKSARLIQALLLEGWKLVDALEPADLLLIDTDFPMHDYRQWIDAYTEYGAKIVIYPHGAVPNIHYDGMFTPYGKTHYHLVPAQGHADIMQRFGYPYPTPVCGWFFSNVEPFEPTAGESILFAPQHPDGEGYLHPEELAINAAQYRALLALGKPLTVRYLGELEANGLWIELDAPVIYKRGYYDNGTLDILRNDVVVASGTYAYMAVAAGKPTVLFQQAAGVEARAAGSATHYEEYREVMDYPLCSDDPEQMAELVQMACAGNTAVEAWKERMIGEAMEPRALSELLTQVVYGDILEAEAVR